jgi:outer membrane protein OmpA-like peptidoglycan-associated protein
MSAKVESTMTDLMTSLAVVFIMLMFAFMQNQSVETSKGSVNRLHSLQNSLAIALMPLHLKCEDDEQDPLACIIRLPDDQLKFTVNKSLIDPQGKQFLTHLVPPIIQTLNSKQHRANVESVYIDGFTDSDGDYEGNLLLSQQRAFSVGYFVISDILKKSPFRTQLIQWMYVNGRGENDLVQYLCQTQKCLENKKASRRVEIKIRVKSHEQLQRLIDLNEKRFANKKR